MTPRHTRPRPVLPRLEKLEDRCVLTAFDNQAYVATLYQTLLGRTAEPGGLAYWSNQLAQGSTWQQVAGGIVTSAEYRGRQVEDLYETVLGHPADSTGLG